MAGSQMRRHRKSRYIILDGGVSGLDMSRAWIKKNKAEKLRPTIPRRAIHVRRSPLSQTVTASQKKVTRLKMDRASTIIRNSCAGSSNVESDMSFFFIKGNPFAPAILHQGRTILIPDDHPVHSVDEGCPCTSNFIINCCFTQAP